MILVLKSFIKDRDIRFQKDNRIFEYAKSHWIAICITIMLVSLKVCKC